MNGLQLREGLDLSDLDILAQEYDDQYRDEVRVLEQSCLEHGEEAKNTGHLDRGQLEDMVRWKSNRIVHLVKENDPSFVQSVIETAINTESNQLRIEILTLLHGVGYPVASVILYYLFPEDYPIIDERALWSLSKPDATIDYELWDAYVERCRDLAQETGLTIREVEKALWMYAKKNQ